MPAHVEYGIFFSPDREMNGDVAGKKVATLNGLTEVGVWFSDLTPESRARYVVRQRTVTYGAWTEVPE